jgi:hypothetical protein
MRFLSRSLVAASVVLAGGVMSAQNSNDSPWNNGGDVVFIYSSPSSGFSSLAFPPDVTGDLYWRAQPDLADVDAAYGAGVAGHVMEVDGYYESLFDTDWSSTPSFYVRMHGPAVTNGLGGLEPSFFTAGLGGGVYPETVVLVGPSGFGNPCTIAPSLCSPSGGTCPPVGFVNGYLVDIQFGSALASGVVVPATKTASDYALTYFVTGGMTASGGTCGLGDYDLQDVHSTDESQADSTGNGINPDGGFQLAGGGAVNEGVASMAEGHEAWRGNYFQPIADSGLGGGVENGDNGGGAMNGRRLPVGSGLATLGGELRDFAAVGTPNLGVGALSLARIPFPGLTILGGTLLLLPDGLFNATSGVWQAPVTGITFVFTAEGRALFAQLPVPPTAVGATVHAQAARLNIGPVLTLNSTNQVAPVTFYP